MDKKTLLIVDDSDGFREDIRFLLESDFNIVESSDLKKAYSMLETQFIDLILLDVDLGNGFSGVDLLKELERRETDIPVLMVSKDHSIETVVECMKLGAAGYVGKKPDLSELKINIDKAIRECRLRSENRYLKSELDTLKGTFIGEDHKIKQLLRRLRYLAQNNCNFLILGESGTGKEVLARQAHGLSNRADGPFIAVNCASIPKDLFESELFGFEKGAFTNAYKGKKGKFQLAEKGTIFLDEISEMDLEHQAKILRVVEYKMIDMIGAEKQIPVDVRIIAASNRDIAQMVKEGKFRADLYYRLNVASLTIPPLRERVEDIPLIIDYYVKLKGAELKKPDVSISPDVIQLLKCYRWPGNVRELINLIERALIFCKDGELKQDDFPDINLKTKDLPCYEMAKKEVLHKFQEDYLKSILRETEGNISKAATKMGISRQGLQKMIKQLGI